jgi:AbrB family looped-hinge helix DNA binding protein
MSTTMGKEVLVTRKGQTTIPAELRVKYRITEGARLVVVDTGDQLMGLCLDGNVS